MTTIVDVSKRAGVSVATVSRVLNGKGHVSPTIAERVRAAIAELEYAPNVSARNLRRNERRILLVLTPNITNPYYAHIIAGISQVTRQRGYSAFLCDTEGRQDQAEAALRMLSQHQADGAILLATELGSTWLSAYAPKYPLVQCSEFDPGIDIPHVCIDNYQAALDVMNYLLSLGHKRIGLVSSVNRYNSTALRLQGYRDALTAAALPALPEHVRYAAADYGFASGLEAARSLLSQEKRPTALFCISDMLALGALASAQEMGFRVPQDVTIVGFDDVEQTTMLHPHMTTMAQPCFALGQRATELLLAQIAGEPAQREVLLPHRLMVRESSATRRSVLDFTAGMSGR